MWSLPSGSSTSSGRGASTGSASPARLWPGRADGACPGAAMRPTRRAGDARPIRSATCYLTLPGSDRAAKRVIIGSHLDSVQQGGNYDGAAGVLAGLAAVAGMKRAGFVPGARRHRDGDARRGGWRLVPDQLSRQPRRPRPAEARGAGGAAASTAAARWPSTCAEEGFDPGFVEPGEQLDRRGRHRRLPRSCISSRGRCWMRGQSRSASSPASPAAAGCAPARVLGEYNHSGGTPRKYRRDAAIALADLAHRAGRGLVPAGSAGHRMVCTFCMLATTAGGRLHQDRRRGALPARCPQRQPAQLRRAVRGALRQGRRDRGAARRELRARRRKAAAAPARWMPACRPG